MDARPAVENRSCTPPPSGRVLERFGGRASWSRYNPEEPFGVELFPTDPSPNALRFTGQEEDASTGNLNLHFRFYQDAIGRFLKPDNIPGNLGNPQSWNRYSYCGGNPVNMTDPSGHYPSLPGGHAGWISTPHSFGMGGTGWMLYDNYNAWRMSALNGSIDTSIAGTIEQGLSQGLGNFPRFADPGFKLYLSYFSSYTAKSISGSLGGILQCPSAIFNAALPKIVTFLVTRMIKAASTNELNGVYRWLEDVHWSFYKSNYLLHRQSCGQYANDLADAIIFLNLKYWHPEIWNESWDDGSGLVSPALNFWFGGDVHHQSVVLQPNSSLFGEAMWTNIYDEGVDFTPLREQMMDSYRFVYEFDRMPH